MVSALTASPFFIVDAEHICDLTVYEFPASLIDLVIPSVKNPDSLVESYNQLAPLHSTVLKHHQEVVTLLANHQGDVDITTDHGETPLHLAVIKGNVETARELLDNGPDINVQNSRGEMPLHMAVTFNYQDITEFLLSRNADVDLKDTFGFSSLALASSETTGMVEFFAEYLEEDPNGLFVDDLLVRQDAAQSAARSLLEEKSIGPVDNLVGKHELSMRINRQEKY